MAADQKIENLLNLALDATKEEREKSLELEVGYDAQEREWELIVKYSGSLAYLRDQGLQVTELSGGYAIITVPQSQISFLSAQPQIEYIEKPKRLFFSAAQGRTASCMDALQLAYGPSVTPGASAGLPERGQTGSRALLGQGTLIAVIDSGVDYTHPDFCNPDGSTRILAIWDQTVAGNPPTGYTLGTEYTKAQIDEALRTGARLPTRDISGHGTQVLGIAAGNGSAADRGVAPLAHILVVKLGNPRPDSFPKTTELMQAIDYVIRRAQQWDLPVAVNLSFGNVYGPHNGTGLLEMFLADSASRWRSVFAVGAGNEGAAAGHTSGVLQSGERGDLGRNAQEDGRGGQNRGAQAEGRQGFARDAREIQLGIASYETAINVQFWKSYADEFEISLIHPNGQVIGPLSPALGAQRYRAGGTELLVFYGEPSPYSISQEIYFDFLPVNDYIDSGIWRFRLAPVRIADGRYDMWLPQAQALNPGTRFYEPSAENTITIPATARGVISVGAYDSRSLTYAPFSGRGSLGKQGILPGYLPVKPDLAAPGVNIRTTAVGGGYTTATGTSFAAPFVTGAAAMLMQWGIVNGNDPYLYGEKVRAYLIRGARPLPGFRQYPNNQVGYGALCVRESLPG